MFNNKSIIVLFIDRNRFQFYGANLSGIETLDVPDSSIRDLDVVNRDVLYTLIKQWVKLHTLVSVQLVLIFAETSYFEKVFTLAAPAQLETDIIKFFDEVPFESTITKVHDIPNGKRAVAINKALYEAIRQGFLLQGLTIKGVIPMFALGELGSRHSLDAQVGEYVLKNIDTLLRQSLVDVAEVTVSNIKESGSVHAPPHKKSSLPILLGVFGILLVIFLIMIFLVR